MESYFLQYVCVVCTFFGQARLMASTRAIDPSDNPMRERVSEKISSYQQAVSVDFFVFTHLPQAYTMSVDNHPQLNVRAGAASIRALSPLPSESFLALLDDLKVIPPGTMGAVGLNHVMTILNDRVEIQTKTGIILNQVRLADFWNDTTAFDPQLVYDLYNKRWIATVAINGDQPSSGLLVAVSQTSDPTGGWYRFSIKGDPDSLLTVDYPRLGFNNKWVAIQANMLNIIDGSFNSSKVFVFNKSQLYEGLLGTVKVFNLIGLGDTQTPVITYDNAYQTLHLLQNWSGNFWGKGYLRLWAIDGPRGSETIRIVGYPRWHGATWSSTGPFINGGFAPQLDTTARVDTGDARVSSAVYRNGSVWGVHTVYLPEGAPVRAGIQWWQIDPVSLAVQQFGRIEDHTNNKHLAYPSIGVNKCNDVLIGYSQFSPIIYPSAAYAFRYGTDPAHGMRKSRIFKAGRGIYNKDLGSGKIFWGKYSSTVLDPNGLDMWTLQEYAEIPANGASRWGTWWAKIKLVDNSCIEKCTY